MQTLTATYSPDDNKLRLYSSTRLDADTYDRVKAAGFGWAPKQDLFVAPAWTPGREDLLTELCGEIDDEDTSLVDRAAERAERFEEYSEKRADDAERAREGVASIADNIPLGQPILVGHHSERHARKDAERIENGMRRAVKMWETSKYWEQRAAGALAHAKYKERPDVRARRIKTIEADKRKQERTISESEKLLKHWCRVHEAGSLTRKDGQPTTIEERAKFIANHDHISQCFPLAQYPREAPASQYEGTMGLWSALEDGVISGEQAQAIAVPVHERRIAHAKRWIAHYENRIAYERAMLAEAGGTAEDKFQIVPGGKVLVGRYDAWLTVIRVNRVGGRINSLTTTPPRVVHWQSTWKVGVEEAKDYRPPEAGERALVKEATKLAPLCNYPGEGFQEITDAEWKKKPKDYKCVRTCKAVEGEHGAYRYRTGFVPGGSYRTAQIYITDLPRKDPPPYIPEAVAPELPRSEPSAPRMAGTERKPKEPTAFDVMKEQLKEGVKVVSAPQLFPTPPEVAARMVDLARVDVGQRVLEPSAGTGNIVYQVAQAVGLDKVLLTAVEINGELAGMLRNAYPEASVHTHDFLECAPEDLGLFDVILMNPPFVKASDIKHIEHAMRFLTQGGTLVAICANGPRQNEKLKPMADYWVELPADTFKEQGTSVRTVLLAYVKG